MKNNNAIIIKGVEKDLKSLLLKEANGKYFQKGPSLKV